MPSFTATNQTITYHATGLVAGVPHADGSTDTITADANAMARPAGISFDGFTFV